MLGWRINCRLAGLRIVDDHLARHPAEDHLEATRLLRHVELASRFCPGVDIFQESHRRRAHRSRGRQNDGGENSGVSRFVVGPDELKLLHVVLIQVVT